MDEKELKNLQKLIKTLQKGGVSFFKSKDFAIELSKEPKLSRTKTKAYREQPLLEGAYSDEDALFWSSSQLSEDAN